MRDQMRDAISKKKSFQKSFDAISDCFGYDF